MGDYSIDDMPASLTSWQGIDIHDFTDDMADGVDVVGHGRRDRYVCRDKENRVGREKRHKVECGGYYLALDNLGILNEIVELSREEILGNSALDNLNETLSEKSNEFAKVKPGRTPISLVKTQYRRVGTGSKMKENKSFQQNTHSEYSLPAPGVIVDRIDYREPLAIISNSRDNNQDCHQKTTSCSLYSRELSKDFKDYLHKKSVERAINKQRYDARNEQPSATSKHTIYQSKSRIFQSGLSSTNRVKHKNKGLSAIANSNEGRFRHRYAASINDASLKSSRGSIVNNYKPPASIAVHKSRSPSVSLASGKIRTKFDVRNVRLGYLSIRSETEPSDNVRSIKSNLNISNLRKGSPRDTSMVDNRNNQWSGSMTKITPRQYESRNKNVLSTMIERLLKRDTTGKYCLQLKSQTRLN